MNVCFSTRHQVHDKHMHMRGSLGGLSRLPVTKVTPDNACASQLRHSEVPPLLEQQAYSDAARRILVSPHSFKLFVKRVLRSFAFVKQLLHAPSVTAATNDSIHEGRPR